MESFATNYPCNQAVLYEGNRFVVILIILTLKHHTVKRLGEDMQSSGTGENRKST